MCHMTDISLQYVNEPHNYGNRNIISNHQHECLCTKTFKDAASPESDKPKIVFLENIILKKWAVSMGIKAD